MCLWVYAVAIKSQISLPRGRTALSKVDIVNECDSDNKPTWTM